VQYLLRVALPVPSTVVRNYYRYSCTGTGYRTGTPVPGTVLTRCTVLRVHTSIHVPTVYYLLQSYSIFEYVSIVPVCGLICILILVRPIPHTRTPEGGTTAKGLLRSARRAPIPILKNTSLLQAPPRVRFTLGKSSIRSRYFMQNPARRRAAPPGSRPRAAAAAAAARAHAGVRPLLPRASGGKSQPPSRATATAATTSARMRARRPRRSLHSTPQLRLPHGMSRWSSTSSSAVHHAFALGMARREERGWGRERAPASRRSQPNSF
jgi:hypothetical protein